MTVINTNTASMVARDAIQKNNRDMSTAMERLSTGSRINSAKDDAAGLAIADRMSAQISGLDMAVRNANDAISLLQTAEGATKEISNMLSRMRELAVQAGSGTYTDTDRDALNLEFQALVSEMDRIASNTEWNGDKILSGNSNINNETELAKTVTIQLGSGTGQTMDLSLNSWRTGVAQDAQMTAASGTGRDGVDTAKSTVLTLADGTMDFNTSGDTITIAGLTFTADTGTGKAFDASDVVSYILGLEAGQTVSAGTAVTGLTNITVGGTLTANHKYEAVAGDVNALKITNLDSGATSYAVATSTAASGGSTAASGTVAQFTNQALAVAQTTMKMVDTTMNKEDSITIAGITFTADADGASFDVSAVTNFLTATITPGTSVNAHAAGLTNIKASGTLLANHTYATTRIGATDDYFLTITNTDDGATKYTAATKNDASGDNVMAAVFDTWVNRGMDVNKNASAYGTAVLSFGASSSKIDIDLVANAQQAITEIDAAINGAAAERSKYGAYMSRLQYAADNLSNVATNTAASRSQIADADYASETTELARAQIISQASTAMLAQANQVKQTVLALLQ
ncbi:flagellin [Gammaproteobacteria bacterium]|nr:flagellin [Gammaproteobacteria bacterium]